MASWSRHEIHAVGKASIRLSDDGNPIDHLACWMGGWVSFEFPFFNQRTESTTTSRQQPHDDNDLCPSTRRPGADCLLGNTHKTVGAGETEIFIFKRRLTERRKQKKFPHDFYFFFLRPVRVSVGRSWPPAWPWLFATEARLILLRRVSRGFLSLLTGTQGSAADCQVSRGRRHGGQHSSPWATFFLLLFPLTRTAKKNKKKKKEKKVHGGSWHDTLDRIHIPFHNVFIFSGFFFFLACVLWVETFLPVLSASAYVNVCIYTLGNAKGIRWRRIKHFGSGFSIFQIHKWLISVRSNQHSRR
jgi:hypothetical protein